jgi:6-phosphogluconate dehydrogenase (decarboxylating)
MIIQAIRYNYEGRNVKNFEFSELNNNVVVLNDVFDKTEDKLILYILPDCESCMKEIEELSSRNKLNKSQIIVISVGLTNFNYQEFHQNNFKHKEITFLIDKNNTFFRDFGLGFTEEFPTLIKYNLNTSEFKKIAFSLSSL